MMLPWEFHEARDSLIVGLNRLGSCETRAINKT